MKNNVVKGTFFILALLVSGAVSANFSSGMQAQYNGGGNPAYMGGGQAMPPGSLVAQQPGAYQAVPRGVGEHQAYAMTPQMGCAPRGARSSIEAPIQNGMVVPADARQHQ